MKKLTKEEVEKLLLREGRSTHVRTEVMNLAVGEFLMIARGDWNAQRGPGQMLTRLKKISGKEFTVKSIADKSGWVVERVK